MLPASPPVVSRPIEESSSSQCNCDFPGIADYICKCCKTELVDYMGNNGIICSEITANGYFICIKYSRCFDAYRSADIASLFTAFLSVLLSNIQYAIIPQATPKRKELIEDCVFSYSNQYDSRSPFYS